MARDRSERCRWRACLRGGSRAPEPVRTTGPLYRPRHHHETRRLFRQSVAAGRRTHSRMGVRPGGPRRHLGMGRRWCSQRRHGVDRLCQRGSSDAGRFSLGLIVLATDHIAEQRLMTTPHIRFNDGAGYERYMGTCSQLVGEAFLDWLTPAPGLRWLDVGCGNGAFTELVVERCAPASVHGIDPSDDQLAYARTRTASRITQFRQSEPG